MGRWGGVGLARGAYELIERRSAEKKKVVQTGQKESEWAEVSRGEGNEADQSIFCD